MPVGTVRGRYELDAPALRTLKDLERQGIRTQTQMREVGEAMDRIAGQEDANRLRTYNMAQAEVRRGAERMGRTMRTEWVATTRVIRTETRKQVRALAELEAALDRIAARRASARVSVRGAGPATAKLAALDTAMDRVDRGRLTGFVGGGAPPRAPRVQTMGGGGGGGGAGRGIVRSVGLGGLNLGGATLPLIIGGGAVVGRSLIGGAGAVAGSAGLGLAGAGALGVAGGGALGVGLLGGLLTKGALAGRIEEAQKATEAYSAAVADFGRRSDQARRAKMNLDQAMATAPRGTRQLLRDVRDLRKEFDQLTAPGQRALMGLAVEGVGAGRRLLRRGGARSINRVDRAIAREGGRFGMFLSGRTGQRFLRQGAGIFDENLGNARLGVQGVFGAGTNVMQASRPIFREMTDAASTWLLSWSRSTRNIEHTRDVVRGMVGHLRSWWRLTRATGGLLGSLMGAGAPEGQRAVDRLTMQLREWEAWVRANPRQVREFFRETVNSSIDLARALGRIVEALSDLGKVLTPVLDRFSQLVALSGSLGLLTPGAGALAFGAFRGARGGFRGGGGGGAGGAGIVPVGGGGRVGGMLRGAARTPGYIGGTYSLARSFGYGRTASAAAAAGGALAGPGRIAGMAARGAGRAFWPIALGMGVLDFASFQGDIGGRLQNAASGATLGLIPRPISDAERQDRGLGRARDFLSHLPQGAGLRQQQTAIAALRNQIGMVHGRATARENVVYRGMGGVSQPRSRFVLGEGERRELASQNRELRTALAERVALYRQYRRQRNQQLDAISRRRGLAFAGEIQQGYRRRARRDGVEGAFGETADQILRNMRRLRPAGARELAQASLNWAAEARRKNPKLEDEYRQLTTRIIRRFKRMGKDIRIVEGQILDGSKREWKGIADAMASQARRGVDQTSKEYQRLQRIAIGALMQQGFTREQARNIATAQRRGPTAASRARGNAAQQNLYERGGAAGFGDGWGRGMGARRPRTGDGPGRDIGRVAASGASRGSMNLMGADPRLGGYAALASNFGLRVSSGRRPGSITSAGNVSYHSSGHALDLAGSPDAMRRFALYMARHYGRQLEELIYSPLGWSIKNGRRTSPYAVADHYDHVHIADTDPRRTGGGGFAGGINLRARRSGLGGVPGALADRAMANIARGMNQAINRRAGGMFPGGGMGPAGPGGRGMYNASSLARLWKQAGGDPSIARLMGAIGMAESAGNTRALGIPTSGGRARGLWQIMWPLHAARFRGMNPYNALDNARMAVSIYRSQGLGAWEAYTRGMHRRFMGDGWGRAPGGGMRHMSSSPSRSFSGRRRSSARSMKLGLRGGGSVSVSFAGAHFTVRSHADIEAIANAVGAKLLDALNGDAISDEALID